MCFKDLFSILSILISVHLCEISNEIGFHNQKFNVIFCWNFNVIFVLKVLFNNINVIDKIAFDRLRIWFFIYIVDVCNWKYSTLYFELILKFIGKYKYKYKYINVLWDWKLSPFWKFSLYPAALKVEFVIILKINRDSVKLI